MKQRAVPSPEALALTHSAVWKSAHPTVKSDSLQLVGFKGKFYFL